MHASPLSTRKVSLSILSAALLLALFCLLQTDAGAAELISADQAKSIAMNHAGVSESDTRVVKLKRYHKRGEEVYDVIFVNSNAKYQYDINAVTGEIISYSRNGYEGEHFYNGTNLADNHDLIGSERAKQIAFDHARVSGANVRRLQVKLDRDDGRTVYEIEFKHDFKEYEYEIDAFSGRIVSFSIEDD